MRYSVVTKFLAIVLCALSLLGCVAGTAGIFVMNESGLYQKTWYDAYQDYRSQILQQTAEGIVNRYAAETLGGLDKYMVQSYYGEEWFLRSFHSGQMGYTVYDETGKPVQTLELSDSRSFEIVEIAVSPHQYPKAVEILTAEEYNTAMGITEPTFDSVYHSMGGSTTVYDAVPEGGAVVHSITAGYENSSEGVGSPEGLGLIFHDSNGYVVFQADMGGTLDVYPDQVLLSIRFENDELGLLYDISDPQGVGRLSVDENGVVTFRSDTPNPDYAPVPETTIHPTEAVTEESVPSAQESPAFGGFSVGANIYGAPNPDSEPVGTVEEGDLTLSWEKYRINDADWYFGEKGWVPAESVAAAELTVISDAVISLYDMPSRSAQVVGQLEAGTQIELLRIVNVQNEEWALTRDGWLIVSQLVQKTEEPAAPAYSEGSQADQSRNTAAATEAVEETTVPPALPEEMIPEETVPEIQERAVIPSGKYLTYYDPSQGQDMTLCYTMEQAPGYKVVFSLTNMALREDAVWRMLELVYQFRNSLIPILAISALMLAVFTVYLCCAAGHSRRNTEVQPGGLNRLPLDGYFVLLCCAGTGIALALIEGVPYLLEGSLEVAVAFGSAAAYAAAVLMVVFGFACAAQFKTPGGYWWRNSLCGWLYRMLVKCIFWGIRVSRVVWRKFRSFCSRMAQWLDGAAGPWTIRAAAGLWKILCALASVVWQCLGSCLRQLKKWLSRLETAFVRFIGKLPMTWQWLMAGFAMIILLALTVNTRFGFWGICGTIALVLYGAHAFGTLLGGVKRMNKGDLDNKVDDKFLVGSFRDFAEELNGLADVAVIAARKQLKSERMKTELITNVSHDIKTPLTSIINYVDLLEKPHTEQEQTAYLEVLSRQSQRLKKLVDDLMEMSKASTGNMAVDIATVDAAEAVNQALGEFGDKLEKAQLIPVFRQPEAPVAMLADGRLVWRVLSNLLGNAVKYALPGTRIYLDLNRVEDKVILSIKNISREELNVSADELLERFVRGDVSRNTEGSGLGLNIAKSLMELQKGSLQLLVDGDLFKVTLIFPAAE